MLVPTKISQPGISTQSRVHLLGNTDLKLQEKVNEGTFSEKEHDALFNREGINIKVVRTAIRMEGIDLYREESVGDPNKIFIMATYGMQKWAILDRINLNITGSFFISTDPMNANVTNIIADYFKLNNLYDSSQVICNYPEAFLTPVVNLENITSMNSHDFYVGTPLSMIRAEDPGNITVTNFDCTGFTSSINFLGS